MKFVHSSSKQKSKSGHVHRKDDRDREIDELLQKLEKEIDEKDRILAENYKLKEHNRQVLEDSQRFYQLFLKWKKECKEKKDKNEELLEQLERKDEKIKEQVKVIIKRDGEVKQKDHEIRQKDKEIDDLRVSEKSLSLIIKDERNDNAVIREKATSLKDENKRLHENVSVLKGNQETLLAENKKLREEKAKLEDWVHKERQLALEKEARLQREEKDRRDAERRLPRRRLDDDYLDDPRFPRPMPSRRGQTGWGSDY
jgi:chromosome segregation ATPase